MLTPRAEALIQRARVARLATASPEAEPHVVPICFAYDGVAFYSVLDAKPKRVASERLKRVRNIRANPRVALLIDEYDEEWSRLQYVLILGEAELLASGEEHARALARLREKYPRYREMSLDAAVMIKIRPRRAIFWSAAEAP